VTECCWRIPKDYKEGMRVDGLIFADEAMIEDIKGDQAPEQVANVAFLPGIQQASLAMPDIHWGYGFPIGGVCATDPDEGGVISPGGVGYDINCGVRLMRSNLFYQDVKPHLQRLMDQLFQQIPAGTGRGGKYRYSKPELRRLMAQGVAYLQDRNLATDGDIEHTEARGCLAGAVPDEVSDRALERGSDQCGTLGSGNHFLEVQVVEAVFDAEAARVMGLEKDMVCVMIHSGSRGLGYQVCDDALKMLRGAPTKYGIQLPDRQLACAPIDSDEGRRYLGAMGAAANFAWCNRQLLMWQARECFAAVFGRSWQQLQMGLVYDVAHNIAKFEQHRIGGQQRQVWVHRKGATRAFPARHPETPSAYQGIGQPVIIPGDMGRASWVLVGQAGSMEQTFGTCCHGAGRRMSRTAAVKHAQGRRIDQELAQRGILARARSWKGLAEEQPDAYKDVNQVVDVVHRANLAAKVARMRPIGVVKG
jgi:tRNA-splicing ligase RtcB